jgi:flagellar secretion chaperone FliS
MTHASLSFRRTVAVDRYKTLELNSLLETANPYQLVAILYEELGRALDVLQRTLAHGRDIRFHPQVDRARSILISLESGLDFEAGGQLAETLGVVYRSMRKELANAVADANPAALLTLKQGVESVSSAWTSLRS